MPASFVETGIIFLSSYDNRIPQMEVLKKLEKKEVKEVKAICFMAKYTSLKGCWL